jgi:hypothetical protein
MKKYIVRVPEVHVIYIEVEAESPVQAKDKVKADRTLHTEIHSEYSHDLDSNLWSVEERQ